jgi:hypothetical protein
MNMKRWSLVAVMLVGVAAGVWAAARLTRPSRTSAASGSATAPSLLHAVP